MLWASAQAGLRSGTACSLGAAVWRHAEEASSALGVQLGAVEVQEASLLPASLQKVVERGGTGGGRGPASSRSSVPRVGQQGAGFMARCSVRCCPRKEEC